MVKQLLHIAMCLIVYVSTAGISVHSHYCKSELKAVSFYKEAQSCHTAKKSCPHHPPQENDRKDCCNNEVSFEKMEVEIPTSLSHITELPIQLAAFVISPLKLNLSATAKVGLQQRYRPPPSRLPLYIQFQSFLC